MKSKLRVTAIVPTFNRRALFAEALRSFLEQSRRPDTLLVLANGCTDGTEDDLARLERGRESSPTSPELGASGPKLGARSGELPELRVLRSDRNLGASRGMRVLFEEALKTDPDWIWVLDDDGIAFNDALEKLLACREADDPEAYILESMIVDAAGEWSPPNRPARFIAGEFRFEGVTPEELSRAATESRGLRVDTGGYCGMLIRPKAFREMGFPRDELHLWCDDVEFVMRVSARKGVYLIPSARIRHRAQAIVPRRKRWPFRSGLAEIPEDLLWRYYYLDRNWLWLAKQWLPRSQYGVFWVKHVARGLAAPVLLGQKRILRRWTLVARAGFDAIFDRLGERVRPDGTYSCIRSSQPVTFPFSNSTLKKERS